MVSGLCIYVIRKDKPVILYMRMNDFWSKVICIDLLLHTSACNLFVNENLEGSKDKFDKRVTIPHQYAPQSYPL